MKLTRNLTSMDNVRHDIRANMESPDEQLIRECETCCGFEKYLGAVH